MLERARHYRSATKDELTPRQHEVLGLIAAGKTNPEIAERLGITLDGAKFHVREILGKLEVDSREEAAAWWRAQRGVSARVASAARALLPGSWLKTAIAGSALGGLALGSVVVGLALNGGSGKDPVVLPACNADEFIWSIEVAPSSAPVSGLDYALFASSVSDCQLDAVIGVAGYGATLDGRGGAVMFDLGDPVAVTIEKQRVSPEPAALIVGTVTNVCNAATGLMVDITTPEQSSFYAPMVMPICEDPPRGAGFTAEWVANWKARFGTSGTPAWWGAGPAPATPTALAANLSSCDLPSLRWSLASVVDPSAGLRFTWSVTAPAACLLEGEVTVSVVGAGLQVDLRNLPPDPSSVSIRQSLAVGSTPVISGTVRNVCGVPGLAISAAITGVATISLDAPVPECLDPNTRAALTAEWVVNRTPGALVPVPVQPRSEATQRP